MRFIQSSLLALSVLAALACSALAGPVTVVHQGRLTSNGSPVTGTVDLRVTVFDDASAGSVVEGPITVTDVDVADGLFTAEIPMSDTSFDGSPRWFEIEAAEAGTGSWFTLSPRQRVGVTPEAAHANRANSADEAAIALFALDGPFAVPDPVSASGLPPTTTTTTTLEIGGNVTGVRLHGTVRMESPYAIGGGGVQPAGDLPSFTVTVGRAFEAAGPVDLRAAFYGPPQPITIEIVTHEHDFGTTVWAFDGGVAVGYRVESGSAGGAIEELTVLFEGSQQGSLAANRDFYVAPTVTANPVSPSLAKATDPDGSSVPGDLVATWNGAVLGPAVVDTAFAIGRDFDRFSGQIGSVAQYGLVSLRGGVLRDDALFADFETRRSRALLVDLVDKGASTPVLQAQGLIVAVELSLADDGRLIEDYEFVAYDVQP